MREYRNKKVREGRWRSPMVLIAMALILASFILGVVKIYPRSREAIRLNAEAKDEKQKVTDRKNGLEDEVKKLQTETGEEEVLRKRFSVKKSGEEVLVILEKDSQNAKVGSEPTGNFLLKIWGEIKNIF